MVGYKAWLSIAVFLVTAGFLVFYLSWGSGAPAPASASEDAQKESVDEIPFKSANEWIGRLKSRAEVSFIAEGSPSGIDGELRKELRTLTSLGRLEGSDFVHAESVADFLYTRRSSELLKHQKTMNQADLKDAHKEAELLLSVDVALAVKKSLIAGDYIVLPQGQQLPLIPGDEFLSMGVMREGIQGTAVFILSMDDHPQLATLKSYARTMQEASNKAIASRFNNLDWTDRKRMIERRSEIGKIPEREWTADDRRMNKEWFPIGLVGNHKDYRMAAVTVTR